MNVPLSVIRSLDQGVRPYLIDGRAQYFDWLLLFTFMVGIGVAMEGPEIVHEVRKVVLKYWNRNRRPALILSINGLPTAEPERTKFPLVHLISLLGWILVAIGVVGEYALDGKVSQFDSTIQGIDSQLIASAGAEAESANREAIDARDRSAASDKRAQIAFSEASRAFDRAARASEQAGIATTEAAKSNKLAADESLARADLEARIAPRTILLPARQRAGIAMSRFAASFFGRKLQIHWEPSDLEAAVFGVEIRDTLLRAGIKVDTDGTTIVGSSHFGVSIVGTVRDIELIRYVYNMLQNATDSGCCTWEVNPKYSNAPVTIDVGAKPPLGLVTLGQTVAADTVQPYSTPAPDVERKLSDEQKSLLATTLRPFLGQRFNFFLYPNDPEVGRIAVDIDQALNMAGWIGSAGRPPSLLGVRGIYLELNLAATSRDRNAAEWLATELSAAGIKVIGPKNSNVARITPITITVGRNP